MANKGEQDKFYYPLGINCDHCNAKTKWITYDYDNNVDLCNTCLEKLNNGNK